MSERSGSADEAPSSSSTVSPSPAPPSPRRTASPPDEDSRLASVASSSSSQSNSASLPPSSVAPSVPHLSAPPRRSLPPPPPVLSSALAPTPLLQFQHDHFSAAMESPTSTSMPSQSGGGAHSAAPPLLGASSLPSSSSWSLLSLDTSAPSHPLQPSLSSARPSAAVASPTSPSSPPLAPLLAVEPLSPASADPRYSANASATTEAGSAAQSEPSASLSSAMFDDPQAAELGGVTAEVDVDEDSDGPKDDAARVGGGYEAPDGGDDEPGRRGGRSGRSASRSAPRTRGGGVRQGRGRRPVVFPSSASVLVAQVLALHGPGLADVHRIYRPREPRERPAGRSLHGLPAAVGAAAVHSTWPVHAGARPAPRGGDRPAPGAGLPRGVRRAHAVHGVGHDRERRHRQRHPGDPRHCARTADPLRPAAVGRRPHHRGRHVHLPLPARAGHTEARGLLRGAHRHHGGLLLPGVSAAYPHRRRAQRPPRCSHRTVSDAAASVLLTAGSATRARRQAASHGSHGAAAQAESSLAGSAEH